MPQVEIDMPPCPRLHAASFALCFDWIFGREFYAPPRFRRMNKSRNRRLASQSSTPHPPTPSPLKRGEGEKSHRFRSNPERLLDDE